MIELLIFLAWVAGYLGVGVGMSALVYKIDPHGYRKVIDKTDVPYSELAKAEKSLDAQINGWFIFWAPMLLLFVFNVVWFGADCLIRGKTEATKALTRGNQK